MTPLNEANANKMCCELVRPQLQLLPDSDRSQFQRHADNLLEQLRARETDDLEFAYTVRNDLIKWLLDRGVAAHSGTGNLFAEVKGDKARLDFNLNSHGIPTLRDYQL